MRLILDAHVSGPILGRRLTGDGHDVRALDQEPDLEGLADEPLLELAAADERVLITFNIADFPGLLREWAGAGRPHAGVILVYGIDHGEFEVVVRGVERWLALYPEQQDWIERSVVVSRAFAA